MLGDLAGDLVRALEVGFESYEGADRLAGVLVCADHRAFGDLRVGDHRRFDLGGRESVAGDVDHIVDTAEDPEVAVLSVRAASPDEISRLAELRVIGLLEPLLLPVKRAEHCRPWPPQHEQALLAARARCPSSSRTAASIPGSGLVADPGLVSVTPGSGLIRIWPVSVCHQVSTTGQRSPPITL